MNAPTTMHDCPEPEMLAAFIDGRLDAEERRKVIDHLSDCDDCRDIVVAAHELERYDGASARTRVVQGQFGSRRWIAAAASLAAAATLILIFAQPLRERFSRPGGIESLVAASADLPYRSVDGRLAATFPHKPLRPRTRTSETRMPDPGSAALYQAAGWIQNNESNDLHALGVAHLLLGRRDTAVQSLERALAAAPPDRRDAVALDLSTALLTRGEWNGDKEEIRRAGEIAEGLWRSKPTPEAAWNRAVAAELLHDAEAGRRAWDDYLRLDSDSPWAAEARRRRSELRDR